MSHPHHPHKPGDKAGHRKLDDGGEDRLVPLTSIDPLPPVVSVNTSRSSGCPRYPVMVRPAASSVGLASSEGSAAMSSVSGCAVTSRR